MKITRAVSDNNNPNVPKYGRRPFNEHQWMYLADRLREFAELETSLYIDIFALNWGYSPYKLKKKWYKENDYFSDAVEYAISVINCRRNDMLTFSPDIVDRKDWLDKRPLYDQEYKEWRIEEKQSAKPESLTGGGKIIVAEYMPVPSDERVKPLKADECKDEQ